MMRGGGQLDTVLEDCLLPTVFYEESLAVCSLQHFVLYESTACLWSSSSNLRARSRAKCPCAVPDLSEREGGRKGWAVGGQQWVYCSSLTYLHAADFHCLPTLLTITERLCTLAAAQHSYTYCGPLSKETCTTSPGVLPKRPQPQFLLRDLSQHCSAIWALPPVLSPHRSPSLYLLLPFPLSP